MLSAAPLLWAGNAIVGRLAQDLISPFALNLVRWCLALLFLLPLGWQVLSKRSAICTHWKHFALLGLFGIGCYNALLYAALQTSTPLNVTLVGSSMPVWMLAAGRVLWGTRITGRQWAGAVLSIVGVAVVMARGDMLQLLQLQFVVGDLLMVLATICWALYTWMLSKSPVGAEVRSNWAGFLLVQLAFGIVWSALFSAGEWVMGGFFVQWGWPLVGCLLFIVLGPAILAYRCWGLGVQRSTPAIAGFFANLIPLFTALLSIVVLGDRPHLYHLVAFALIVGGIWVSSRQSASKP